MDKNLIQRSITGSLFVIVVVAAVWFSAYTMFALFLLIGILGLREFYSLSEKAGASPQKAYGLAFAVMLMLIAFLVKALDKGPYVLLPLPFLFLPFFIELYRKKENPFANIGWTLLGIIYVILPICFVLIQFIPSQLLSVYFEERSPWLPEYAFHHVIYESKELLVFFILIWTSDTMAYVCGRLFGRHKLFERVSPKKTWEGFFGGIIFAMVAAGMISNWFLAKGLTYQTESKWIVVGAVISVCGVLGDLSESLFKRSINIKDSGNILPGHGGILDRFDAFLLATPFALSAYWMCEIFKLDFVRMFSH